MIDWVTAKLICNHDPNKPQRVLLLLLDRDGNTEWLVHKKVTVEGSYSTKYRFNL